MKSFLKKSNKIVKIYSKNLFFTSFFLKKQSSIYLQLLYLICRTLDELADQYNISSKNKSFKRLSFILKQLHTKFNDKLDKLSFFIKILKKNITIINITIFIDLITVLLKDIKYPANIKNEKELLYYCYGVAGTIGLLVLPIVTSSRHNIMNAIHLGIFMQLINIARDVLEDAFKGRRYLPAFWVTNIGAKEIIYLSNTSINNKHKLINNAIIKILNLSLYYYKKCKNNIYQLSYTNRFFIHVISSIYYTIHIKLRNSNNIWIYQRIFISLLYKIFLTLKCFFIC